jgi:peptidyl-prolyl cis-trans isomerase SurA
MKHRFFLLPAALCLFLPSALFAQQQEAEKPLAQGVVATVGDTEITLEQYKEFLWSRYGKRPLNQMVDHILVQQAAQEYGISLDKEALLTTFEQRLEQSMQGRSREDFEKTLQEAGQSMQMFTTNLRVDLAHEQRLDQLVFATRVATDDRLQRAFDAQYGAGGVKVRVSHILIMPHFLRAERIRNGEKAADIKPDEMKAAARQLAETCLAELSQGADFAAQVDKYSHDQVSRQNQGELPSYRPGLYGPAFTAAVADLPVGQHSTIIESGAGFHIVKILERKVTKLADVRAALVEEVMNATPTWQDREQVLVALREAGDIKLW